MQPSESQWFAVFTKPRQERIALANLERQGFRCFLPEAINPYQRRTARGKVRVEPLFPRYLFLEAVADQQSLAPVRSSRGVCNLVRFGNKIATMPTQVMDVIRSRLDAETGLVQLDPTVAEPGDQVRVFDGPLAGVSGLFMARTGNQRALVLMELLGRQTTIEVESLLLQKTG